MARQQFVTLLIISSDRHTTQASYKVTFFAARILHICADAVGSGRKCCGSINILLEIRLALATDAVIWNDNNGRSMLMMVTI